jgi:SH3-like domain-containing protein
MHKYTKFFTRCSVLLSIIVLTFGSGLAKAEMLSIAKDGVNLRSGPGTKYEIKWEYGEGFPLRVVSKKGDWYKVKDFEGDTGWIFKSLLTSGGHMIVKVNKKSNKKVNIRSGPGTKFKVVGKAYYGVVFQTLEQKNGWAKLKHDTGLEGWIKRSLLWGF